MSTVAPQRVSVSRDRDDDYRPQAAAARREGVRERTAVDLRSSSEVTCRANPGVVAEEGVQADDLLGRNR